MLSELAEPAVEKHVSVASTLSGAATAADGGTGVASSARADQDPTLAPDKSVAAASPETAATAKTAPPAYDRKLPHEFLIRGVTVHGKAFRPSDWAERLCGVLSSYRPGAQGAGRAAHLGYSPYARPVVIDGVRCVIVDARLRDLEVMAFDFALNFARDNELRVSESGAPPPTSG